MNGMILQLPIILQKNYFVQMGIIYFLNEIDRKSPGITPDAITLIDFEIQKLKQIANIVKIAAGLSSLRLHHHFPSIVFLIRRQREGQKGILAARILVLFFVRFANHNR
jgi:preprotein translocase subunit Sec61beta